MTMLQWTAAFGPSLLHALRCVVERRPVVDQILADALQPFAADVNARSLPADYWIRRIPLAAADNGPRSGWARQWQGVPEIDGAMECEHHGEDWLSLDEWLVEPATVLRRLRPQLVDELSLRQGPIRAQWLARGPGLMHSFRRAARLDSQSDSEIQVISAVPVSGGFGEAYPVNDALLFETLLTDADDRLPELARLAWLVIQLRLPKDLAAEPAVDAVVWRPRVALLVTLALGHQLDWFPTSTPPLGLAVETWLDPADSKTTSWISRLPNNWYDSLTTRADLDRLVQCTLV